MMNLLTNTIFAIISNFLFNPSFDKTYSIEIIDYDYTYAYTTVYKVSNDSLTISQNGELANEKEALLISRKLDEKESELFASFLSVSNLDSLKEYYGDPLGNDGNIKDIKIIYNGTYTRIVIENFYEKKIDSLCRIFNKLIPKKYEISLSH